MNRADPDIAAVRDLPPGPIEPTDESVSRTWHTMTRLRTPPTRSRFRRWVPVAAAVVVAGLTATGVAILPSGGGSSVAPVGSAPSASPPQKTGGPSGAPSASDGPKTAPPLGPPLALGSSKPLNAKQSIDRLAAKVAGSKTETMRPGQLVYTRMWGVSSSDNIGDEAPAKMARDEVEFWFAPDGMAPVAITRNGIEDQSVAGPAGPVTDPGIWQPTPEWLAGLPTTPSALKTELLAGMGENDKWSDDHLLAKEIGELLVSSETLLPADVRVAMLKSIKTWKGLSARETVFDGKRVWAIRQTEQGHVNELLFDPATGRAVGRANGVENTISYQVLWTHKLVGKAGER